MPSRTKSLDSLRIATSTAPSRLAAWRNTQHRTRYNIADAAAAAAAAAGAITARARVGELESELRRFKRDATPLINKSLLNRV